MNDMKKATDYLWQLNKLIGLSGCLVITTVVVILWIIFFFLFLGAMCASMLD